MAIERIDHLCVQTSAFDQTVCFWSATGFDVTSAWAHEDGNRSAMLSAGAASVVVTEGKAPFVSIQLACDDVDALLAGLPAARVISPPEDTHWGTRMLRLSDPDGRVIVFERSTDLGST